MGAGPEAEIENAVVLKAEIHGWFVRKVTWPGRNGAPDRVFAKYGQTIWIEFKAPGETVPTYQTREHIRMRDAGMEVHVCDDVSDALRILEITI